MKLPVYILILFFALGTATFSFAQKKKQTTVNRLQFIGEFDVPYNYSFQNTSIGGLSSIDYNSSSNEYYMICDDRSVINPMRFYTAKIAFDNKKIDTVIFTNRTFFLQPNGKKYPNVKKEPLHAPDPEALRYNAATGQLIWSSEGERIVNGKDTVLQNPAINITDRSGKFIGSFPLPTQFTMQAVEKGPRQNGVFEGLCFTDNGRTMYVTTESPLYNDGPAAGLKDTTTWVWILKYDVLQKKLLAQYAYKLEPIAYEPTPINGFKINGIVDILAVNNNEFLITERSYSTGVKNCTIKLFTCSFKNASNITPVQSLQKNPPQKTVSKKLLLNMDDLGVYIDNIEGVTFGPNLPNGHRSIVCVSDNDFLPNRKTQFLLFEVIP